MKRRVARHQIPSRAGWALPEFAPTAARELLGSPANEPTDFGTSGRGIAVNRRWAVQLARQCRDDARYPSLETLAGVAELLAEALRTPELG